eukprot:33363-Rhodomonas_salina.1
MRSNVFRQGLRAASVGMSAPSRHLSIGVPAGFEEVKDEDGRSRQVCKSCGFKNYKNPKVVVGSVPTYRDSQGNESILLVRRSIWPRLVSTPSPLSHTHECRTCPSLLFSL